MKLGRQGKDRETTTNQPFSVTLKAIVSVVNFNGHREWFRNFFLITGFLFDKTFVDTSKATTAENSVLSEITCDVLELIVGESYQRIRSRVTS